MHTHTHDHAWFRGTQAPLHVACKAGHLACVKVLVEEGRAGVNVCSEGLGYAPLFAAAANGRSDVVSYLLWGVARRGFATADANIRASTGGTALFAACMYEVRDAAGRRAWRARVVVRAHPVHA